MLSTNTILNNKSRNFGSNSFFMHSFAIESFFEKNVISDKNKKLKKNTIKVFDLTLRLYICL